MATGVPRAEVKEVPRTAPASAGAASVISPILVTTTDCWLAPVPLMAILACKVRGVVCPAGSWVSVPVGVTRYSGDTVAPNLLDQDFTATGPDKKWGADISYVWTREGWLYLAVVIDPFARRVVGWATGDRLHRDLALAALRKALVMRVRQQG